MNSGLFITLYDEKTLQLYLDAGVYGFLMKPIFESKPSSRSMHFAALADYACTREGTHVFFFLKRKIVYGGVIKGNKDIASFYLNGDTSPLGREAQSQLFWDESLRYTATPKKGVFEVEGEKKSQPFIIQFEKTQDTGKEISSDELYFELGQFPYPLPSNTIQGMSFCTLTPGEVDVALRLISNSSSAFQHEYKFDCKTDGSQKLFYASLLTYENYINEAHLEFTILADLDPFRDLLKIGCCVLCRQVPISPFKPLQMDRADICIYNSDKPIRNGTIPNIVIELKRDKANYHAYEQVVRYLKWLKRILNNIEEFESISAYIIANDFHIKKSKVDLSFEKQIKMFRLKDKQFYTLIDK